MLEAIGHHHPDPACIQEHRIDADRGIAAVALHRTRTATTAMGVGGERHRAIERDRRAADENDRSPIEGCPAVAADALRRARSARTAIAAERAGVFRGRSIGARPGIGRRVIEQARGSDLDESALTPATGAAGPSGGAGSTDPARAARPQRGSSDRTSRVGAVASAGDDLNAAAEPRPADAPGTAAGTSRTACATQAIGAECYCVERKRTGTGYVIDRIDPRGTGDSVTTCSTIAARAALATAVDGEAAA